MKTCPHCQADIPDQRTQCRHCETPLGPIPILLLIIVIVFGSVLVYARSGDHLPVAMSIRAAGAGGRSVVIHGSSNLPDGTRLVAAVEGLDLSYASRQTLEVRHGALRSEPFDLRAVEPGSFVARLSAKAGPQPRTVKSITGSRFENLVGAFVAAGERGRQIWATRTFSIDASGDVRNTGGVLGPNPTEARRVLGGLNEWLGLEKMFRPGCADDASAVQIAMRQKLGHKALKHSRQLARRAAAVPSPEGGLLRRAAERLPDCFSCDDQAYRHCETMQRDLKHATQLFRER